MWDPRFTTLWAFMACYRDSFYYYKGRCDSCFLGYNISAIQEEFIDSASLIKEKSGKSTPVTDFIHWINKE
jgi:hypothetical protein